MLHSPQLAKRDAKSESDGAVIGERSIIGAGAVGLEMASVWSRLGSKVVVVEMLKQQLSPGAKKKPVPGRSFFSTAM